MSDPPATQTRGTAEQTSVRVLASLFPDALAGWLGGSVTSGAATVTADLDIVVLTPGDLSVADPCTMAAGPSGCSSTPMRPCAGTAPTTSLDASPRCRAWSETACSSMIGMAPVTGEPHRPRHPERRPTPTDPGGARPRPLHHHRPHRRPGWRSTSRRGRSGRDPAMAAHNHAPPHRIGQGRHREGPGPGPSTRPLLAPLPP